MQSRREFIKKSIIGGTGLILIPGTLFSSVFSLAENAGIDPIKFHNKLLTIDSHCDTPLSFLNDNFDLSKDNSHLKGCRNDYVRMVKGGLDGSFFAVFVGQSKRDAAGNKKAKDQALKIFNLIDSNIEKHSDKFIKAIEPDDLKKASKLNKKAIFIGIENGYPIGKDMSMIKTFHDMGTRYITLCHTSNNDICDSSNDLTGPEHNGLSKFGKEVIKEMDRLGIMIDVSHISDDAFYQCLEISNNPVIASHSCTRTVCDNPRNLSDDMLYKLAENNGVIQLCIYSDYVKKIKQSPERDEAYSLLRKKYSDWGSLNDEQKKKAHHEWYELSDKYPQKKASISDAVDHIDHIVKTIGVDHVGIGTDFDGGGTLKDCRDVSELPNITIELLKRY